MQDQAYFGKEESLFLISPSQTVIVWHEDWARFLKEIEERDFLEEYRPDPAFCRTVVRRRCKGMLEIPNCCLAVIDVQGKLAQLMVDKESLFKSIWILIQAAKILEIPILWCQQVPEALGPTVPQIAELLAGVEPIDKATFSCCREERFMDVFNSLDREQVLLCGIEAHVCVYQTAMDLMEEGLDVTVIADAVSSRTEQNRQLALKRLSDEGAGIGSTEMVLFELLRTAKHPQFREIAKLVK
jgi:nicotinamidase-related amidase